MKRTTAIIAAMAAALNCGGISAFAEDKPKAADVPAVIYKQLMDRKYNDLNNDGVIDEEELSQVNYASLDLKDCTDVTWLERMKALKNLTLKSKNDVDISVVAQLDNLEYLSLESLPITDISFTKNMALHYLFLRDMDQITLEQRLDVMRWEDVTVERGFSINAGAYPGGILSSFAPVLRIENGEIADLEYNYASVDEKGRFISVCNSSIYARETGTTEYSIYCGDKRVLSGKVNVVDAPASSLPPVTGETVESIAVRSRDMSDVNMLINKNGFFGVRDGELVRYGDRPLSYGSATLKSEEEKWGSLYGELAVMADGTVRFNDMPVSSEKRFVTGANEFLLTAEGELYVARVNDNGMFARYLTDNIAELIDENPAFNNTYAITKDGELVYLTYNNMTAHTDYTAYPLGIKNIISYYSSYFVDEDNVLWYVTTSTRSEPTVEKIAENVAEVAEKHLKDELPQPGNGTVGGMFKDVVYTDLDGKTYDLGGTEVEVNNYYYDLSPLYIEGESITDMPVKNGRGDNYYLGNDNILTLEFKGNLRTVDDVSAFLGTTYHPEKPKVYFVRTDGSAWEYDCAEDKFTEMTWRASADVHGDANGDGEFGAADLVVTSQYLLGMDVKLIMPHADLNSDGRVDAFDLALMRAELVG